MVKFFVLLILSPAMAFSQSPPCGNDYGTSADEANIVNQMRYGTIQDAQDAITQAKNTRGTALGCPQVAITYSPADVTEPTLTEIENVWNSAHVPAINAYSVGCPRIGRYENNSALGAYYANLAGYTFDLTKLNSIANMMYDQQYASWNIASPTARNEGVYGYVNVDSSDPCYPGGVVGSTVDALCNTLPQYCVEYTSGQYTGETFAISGQDDASNWFDGGLAYDHGWVGVQMIESILQQPNDADKLKYYNSLELAAQYAISEYPVKNHNYTAKLIWLLAEMYALTGDTIYRNDLNYKLEKNLLPGILTDFDVNGFVDGTTPQIAFSSLANVAQTPGRMWDGHNSLAWYHAMNAWALSEAYVAFRDRGDVLRANELKPYVVLMMDNLADEVINVGILSTNQLGVRDLTYAILINIWKISDYESDPHPTWDQAAWAMWNSGYFDAYNTNSVCVGLYLLIQSDTPYVPLMDRQTFIANISQNNNIDVEIFPNPSKGIFTVTSSEKIENIELFDLQGRSITTTWDEASGRIEVTDAEFGQYILRITSETNVSTRNVVIIE